MFKYKLIKIREYILIILTATIFLFQSISDLGAKENIFVVEDVRIEGSFDVNFSRDKLIDRALKKSFDKLLKNILLLEDYNKLKKFKLKEIKNLVYSFKILDERFKNNKYFATFEVIYNDIKIKELLSNKNISFFEPKNTTVVFFPILFVQNEIKIFNENFFYSNWLKNYPENSTIKYLLPLENLDDMFSIYKTQDEIENINFKKLAVEYNAKNYAFAIISYEVDKLKVYLKADLDKKKYNENLSYKLKDLSDESRLDFIIDDLKLKILDMWKRANLIHIPLPLNIFIKFQYTTLRDLHNLEKVLNKINVINTYSLKKFDINTSLYKINYYGDPKKLSDEFYSFDYHLRDNKGYWELEIND